ncbi:hypothetical protein [Brumimicrobium mesophilum]|uniref:hypothetical protein n=1 Tax=Brumimicrobium mesophilum TaxID=392717 RepID=UPI000D141724|nr:hypothetical protein [Brumimicrobium mesophilum]
MQNSNQELQYSNPYEYYGPILCVKARWLYKEACIITKHLYDALRDRGHLNVVRQGKGKGNYALVEFESIRNDIKEQIENLVKPIEEVYNVLEDLIEPDNEAIRYFATQYRKPEGGLLPPAKQREYCTNAIILNACKKFYSKNVAKKKKGWIWDKLSQSVNDLDTEKYVFKLPSTPVTLKRAFARYEKESYMGLVHGGHGNDNPRKINDAIERIILSISAMKNKPFNNWIVEMYMSFMAGSTEIVDMQTGELFNPEDFYHKGAPVTFSEATVWNYVNEPNNQALLAKYRTDSHQYNNNHRPHVHRHAPKFSLSKISLDDRDLPRKLKNGKRVKAYYAYDVASGCVIGASYSRDKDTKLFIDCIKDMLQFLGRNNYGIPMEMEVEHHIVNNFRNDLMKAGMAFPFVRWCNPGNSQEKRAEHFNKSKKYGYEKRYQEGIGRWYAKSEAHRTIVEKVFDGENNNYKEKQFDYGDLVADDIHTIELYNNDLHPNQRKYKGKTRMQVLEENINPNCNDFDDVIWSKYVGDKTTTSIKRNQYMRVNYQDYGIPSIDVMKQLQPNNYEVDAYYIRNEEGNIDYVDVFQGEEYICRAEPIATFNEATAEQTDKDRENMLQQQKFISSYDASIKEASRNKITKLQITEQVKYPRIDQPKEEIIQEALVIDDLDTNDDFERLMASNNSDEWIKKSKDSLYTVNQRNND